MSRLKIQHYVVGPVQTNCYVAINKDTGEAFIVDPGAAGLAEKIRENDCTPVAVLLTHGHFDHAEGAAELAAEFDIPVYAHEAEKDVLESPQDNVSWMTGGQDKFHADIFVRDEQELDIAGFHIRVLFTPGHTKGGCCYYLPYEDVVFSGDTLFALSVGRTDLPTGSSAQLIRSVREKLMPLPDRTAVYTGHGDVSTIETERMYNPFI